MTRLFGISSLVIVVFFWNPDTASACSCWSELPRPTHGELAPSKVKLWLSEETVRDVLIANGQQDAYDTELFHRNGEVNDEVMRALRDAVFLEGAFKTEYPITVTALYFKSLGQLAVVTPLEPLPVGQFRLRVHGRHPDIVLNPINYPDLSFTVVKDDVDTELRPPEVHKISWNRTDDSGMCGGFKSATLEVEHRGWLVAYEIYRPSERGNIPANALRYVQSKLGYIHFGTSACSERWDFNRDSAIVRFGTINLAGKFSGWGPEILLQAPWPLGERKPQSKFPASAMKTEIGHGCGCFLGKSGSASSASDATKTAWGIVLVGLLRRRARRKMHSVRPYSRTRSRATPRRSHPTYQPGLSGGDN